MTTLLRKRAQVCMWPYSALLLMSYSGLARTMERDEQLDGELNSKVTVTQLALCNVLTLDFLN